LRRAGTLFSIIANCMKIAVFLSHPIQHYSPLCKEIARHKGVQLKVFYFSRHGTEQTFDPGFGMGFKWDVDLLEGYESEFLPRQWPTKDPFNSRWNGLNQGISRVLGGGWDVAYVTGYAHLNNWRIANACRRNGVKLLYHSDSNFITEKQKPVVKRLFKKIVVGRFFSKVSVFLSVGDNNRDYLRYYGAPADRIRFCAIPVDTERFRNAVALVDENKKIELRKNLGLAKDDCVIGFCGKLISRKRPQDLVAALQHPSLKGRKVVGLFIGSGEMEAELKQQAADKARFTGFVNQHEMPVYMSLCDVVAMPSEFDPHPIAVTEAQCLKIPVLLSDQCGCHGPNDVFRDGESGFLYPCGDIEKLASGIARLANDQALRLRMGQRANELSELHSARSTAVALIQAAQFAMGQ
jgi:glycosyltransferase involved in cell wall biosynthesis